MPDATFAEHQWLRTFRTRLLFVMALAQGITYIAAPDRQLSSDAYLLLAPIGVTGWRTVGVLICLSGVCLLPLRTRRAAYVALAVLELFLAVMQVLHGWVPWAFILPGGLGAGEVVQMGRSRARQRRGESVSADGTVECG